MSQINFLCVEKRMAALVGWGHEIESNLTHKRSTFEGHDALHSSNLVKLHNYIQYQ